MTVEEVRGNSDGGDRDDDNFPVGMRVLAVDGDPTCLKVLECMLRNCQYHVTTTSLARTALKMLRENEDRFDLVITDVHMPDMDGFKLLELVGLELDLPVIMLSTNSDPKLVMKGVIHGACDYLMKPIRIEELRNIWQHVVRRKKSDSKKQSKPTYEDKALQENKEVGQGPRQSGNADQIGKLNKRKKDEEDEGAENRNEHEDPATQKKPRVVWSVELHRKFVAAVNQLGIGKAVPKRILDLMNVEGLTRVNVASHLREYRLYLKRISSIASQQANMVAALGGLPTQQVPQQNTLQFNAQRPAQQSQHLDQLQKLPAATLNPLGSIIQPQQQLTDIAQQPRHTLINQSLPTSQVHAPLLQAQNLVQTQNVLHTQQQSANQLQRNLPQNLQQSQPQQQQILCQNQQSNLVASQSPDPISQQLNFSENQIQLQLLHKLHQQQQSILAQQSALQQPSQLTQLHDQQKQHLDAPQTFSRSLTSSQMQDGSQTTSTSLPQSHVIPQQITRTNSQNNLRFNQPPQQPKLQQQQSGVLPELHGHIGHSLTPTTNQLSAAGSSLLTGAAGGGQSGITDDIPSCSTSPSSNNCPIVGQPIMNGRTHPSAVMGEEIAQPSAAFLSSNGLETMSASGNFVKDLLQKPDVKPSLNVSKNQNQGFFAHQNFLHASGGQVDYLDSSSSATSVCLSQNDVQLQHNTNQMSFNSQPVLFRDTSQEVQADPRNNVSFGSNIDNQFGMPMMPDSLATKGMLGSGKDFSSNLDSGGGMISSYENRKEPQPELSSSIVSQSFGVPDMTFNSIDSAINDNSFMNTGAWAAPQLPRLRTYTKVYKRGAVGRSIDITRYSGYEELKQDLARRFGIEGQLEDRQRIGWKLVYVDHENDVLLVGDDPWEEFVNCVHCIKILSPQEVQQMSLDGDFGNSVLPNQACSSSDGGNV